MDKEVSKDAFERARKIVSWFAVSIFVSSFTALLVLSATSYWTPDNPLVGVCDRVWRISGLLALVLGAIPYVRRFVRQLGAFFSSD